MTGGCCAGAGTGRDGPGCSNGLGKHGAPDSGCFLQGVKVVEPWGCDREREEHPHHPEQPQGICFTCRVSFRGPIRHKVPLKTLQHGCVGVGPFKVRGGGDLGRVSGEPRGGEAALTLSCSSRLKLRASWSWTSSSGPQDGGWGRESVRGWGRQVGPRGRERETSTHKDGDREPGSGRARDTHTDVVPELVKNSEETNLGCGWEPGRAGPGRPSTQRGKGAVKDGAEGEQRRETGRGGAGGG